MKQLDSVALARLAFIQELRTTNVQQCRLQLTKGDARCVVGLAADLFAIKGNRYVAVKQKLGLDAASQLYTMNDHGLTFPEIADRLVEIWWGSADPHAKS